MARTVKSLPVMEETWVQSLGQEDSWRKEWLLTLVFLSGEFHGQRSLVGYSPWGHKELGYNGVTYIHTHRVRG